MTRQKKSSLIIIFVVDIIFFSIITLFFLFYLAGLSMMASIIKRHSRKSDKKYLFMLTLGIFEEIQKKGVSHMFLERDENGYFDHVYSIHLFTSKDQRIELNERHTIIEYGGKYNTVKKKGFLYLAGILTCFNAFFELYSMIISEQNCILRATDPYIDGLYILLLGKITNTPNCVSIHADFDKRYQINHNLVPIFFGSRKITKILERFVLSHTKLVLPIRESLGEYAVRNGAKPGRIRIIPHGVDILKFGKNLKEQLKKDPRFEGKKLVVFAGRLSKDNYVEDIIKAAKIVVTDYPNTLFVLIGDGPEKDQLSKLIREYNLDKHVIFTGFLPNEKVISIRSLADVNLCLMGGFSLIEAGLSGNPVIAYNVEWHYELIKNGETGYLLEEGNIDSLADSINALLMDPESGKKMGEKMKNLVTEKHSLSATSKIKIDCYEELFKTR